MLASKSFSRSIFFCPLQTICLCFPFLIRSVLILTLCKDTRSGPLSSEGLSRGPPSTGSTSPKCRDTSPVKTDSTQNCKPNYGVCIIDNYHCSYGNVSVVNFSSILSLLYHEPPKINNEPKDQVWLVYGSIVAHKVVLDLFNQAFENIPMTY